MKRLILLLGIQSIMLTFVMLAFGCNNSNTDPALNGKWIADDYLEWTFDNGKFEISDGNAGTFTTKNDIITFKLTDAEGKVDISIATYEIKNNELSIYFNSFTINFYRE